MPAEWHNLHDKIKKENPDMPDSQAWAIATKIYKKRHGGRTPQQDEKAEKKATTYLRWKGIEKI